MSYFGKDGSLTITGPDFHYGYLSHYDLQGRICPIFSAPRIDTTTSQKLISIDSWVPYVDKDNVFVTDKKLVTAVNALSYTLLCIGNAVTEISISNPHTTLPSFKNKILRVAPNPAHTIIHIAGLRQENNNVAILSSGGSILKVVTTSSANNAINVADLKSGVYFIRVTATGELPYVVPFVKE